MLAVDDVVRLTTGEIVKVTDVPEPYEGMVETLFVYTPDINANRHDESIVLKVTDQQFIAEHLGSLVTLVKS